MYTGAYNNVMTAANGTQREHWAEMLFPYTKSAQIYLCPDVSSGNHMQSNNMCGATNGTNPDICNGTNGGVDYSYNDIAYTPGPNAAIGVSNTTGNDAEQQHLSAITSPADTIQMLDGKTNDNTWNTNLTDINIGTYAATGDNWSGGSPTMPTGIDPRHTNGFNVLWYDGHVKYLHNTLKVTPNAPNGGPYYWYINKPANP